MLPPLERAVSTATASARKTGDEEKGGLWLGYCPLARHGFTLRAGFFSFPVFVVRLLSCRVRGEQNG